MDREPGLDRRCCRSWSRSPPALIAWCGWGYRIRDVVVLPRSAEPPPPEADAEPAAPSSGADVDPVADDNAAPSETANGSGAGSDPTVRKLDPERTPEV